METQLGALRFAVRVYDGLLNGLAALAACLLFAIAVLVAVDAVLQHASFLPRIDGVIELTEYSLYGVTVAAAPWALRNGAHISVDILVDHMPESARAMARRFANMVGCAVAWYWSTPVAWLHGKPGRQGGWSSRHSFSRKSGCCFRCPLAR
ncbi:MAG: TRAP transporter small permease subunit [Alphaproteobacteria bacterium]